jgi:hypothetical protein
MPQRKSDFEEQKALNRSVNIKSSSGGGPGVKFMSTRLVK